MEVNLRLPFGEVRGDLTPSHPCDHWGKAGEVLASSTEVDGLLGSQSWGLT